MKTIRELFASDISRRIEEVIKVDQTDEEIVREELSEYVVTDSIRNYLLEIVERYQETPNNPHEGVGVWVSGFFGSGKSSFAKYLGLALENRPILGTGAGELLAQRTGDTKVQVVLNQITEKIPTDAVIFDIATEKGVLSSSQSVVEITYCLLLEHLGYARNLDLAELEITLEEGGRLETFKDTFRQLFDRQWDAEKGKVAIALQQASRVMHEMEKATYPTVDSWREAAMGQADITAGDLAKRALELMDRRRPGRALVFVIDEVGQFVARDVQKMLDLQALVQNLGRVGRGRMWLVVTSQEKLTELVAGLDDKRVELARLMDRFPLQVHLEPSDILEVTSRRVLAKNAQAEQVLSDLFTQHRGRLTDNTRLTADITLPELTTESFVLLYPLLPYQIDLIIQVVSGLRTQGGASRHVGGANRTIIKLAQQLLIHPDVDLQSKPLGTLVRIDQIYDLVSGNIASDVRRKIDDIGQQVDHPMAQPVAKAICLLQYVRSIHRTPSNIAAALHPSVDADSCLPEVKAALVALEQAHMVRLGDDGYRIPTPAEDDWERQRSALSAKPSDVNRIYAETVADLWRPQPSHSLLDVKNFKAGLVLEGRHLEGGDVLFHVTLAEAGAEFEESTKEARQRSQNEEQAVFWTAALTDAVDRESVEVYRSKEILARRERGVRTQNESALVAEERQRLRRHQDELKRLIKQALLTGSIFFRGNDRSPADTTIDVTHAASRVLAEVLPEVFYRFEDAAARVGSKDLEALLTQENLRGLTPVFSELRLLRDEGGRDVFDTERGPLKEVLTCIQNRWAYGDAASGRYLTDHFSKEPYGWDFDVVRLFVASLLRAGKIEGMGQGQTIESALSLHARNTFTNNNHFRQASFTLKEGLEFPELVDAGERYEYVFGHEMRELEASVVAEAIKKQVEQCEPELRKIHSVLVRHNLIGAEMLRDALEQMRMLRLGSDEQTIRHFNRYYQELKEAIKRGVDLGRELTEPRLRDIDRARQVLEQIWPFLESEHDLDAAFAERAAALADLMAKETFFVDLAAIEAHTTALEDEYRRRHQEASNVCAAAYANALVQLQQAPEWQQLSHEQQQQVARTLSKRAQLDESMKKQISLLRAETDACQSCLDKAIAEMLQLVDGQRVVRVSISSYFVRGIETAGELQEGLDQLRNECLQLIEQGKKVWLQ